MTNQLYKVEELEEMTLAQLKTIAAENDITVSDKRSKQSHRAAIINKQEKVETLNSQEAEELKENIVDYAQACVDIAKCQNFSQLKVWCDEKRIGQTAQFSSLYRNIMNYFAEYSYIKATALNLDIGCIDKAIELNARISKSICDEFGLLLVDISIENEGVIISENNDAYKIEIGNTNVATLQCFQNGFLSPQSKMGAADDPYSAAVQVLEWMIGKTHVNSVRERTIADRKKTKLEVNYI
jgi:hypothetical protein